MFTVKLKSHFLAEIISQNWKYYRGCNCINLIVGSSLPYFKVGDRSIYIKVMTKFVERSGIKCGRYTVITKSFSGIKYDGKLEIVSTGSWKIRTLLSKDLPCRYRYLYVFVLLTLLILNFTLLCVFL